MPRLPHALLRKAHNTSPLLPLLIQTCRTLPSAVNELRWLREHVEDVCRKQQPPFSGSQPLLQRLCQERANGVPLQYLIGSQPFGNLDIVCRPGVLIPRPETEAYTSHLAQHIIQSDFKRVLGRRPLKILDLCTGTGCIPLLLHSLLQDHFPALEILGVDISQKALSLAKHNLHHNIQSGLLGERAAEEISFCTFDVTSDIFDEGSCQDIVISNPPYISQGGFAHDTSRSVRNWEPKLALVPRLREKNDAIVAEDIFYPRILDIACESKARTVLMEVGDDPQALRVATAAIKSRHWDCIQIWRDWPEQRYDEGDRQRQAIIDDCCIRYYGSGHSRAVICQLDQEETKAGKI